MSRTAKKIFAHRPSVMNLLVASISSHALFWSCYTSAVSLHGADIRADLIAAKHCDKKTLVNSSAAIENYVYRTFITMVF